MGGGGWDSTDRAFAEQDTAVEFYKKHKCRLTSFSTDQLLREVAKRRKKKDTATRRLQTFRRVKAARQIAALQKALKELPEQHLKQIRELQEQLHKLVGGYQ